jgi:hypothetical protein
MDRRIQPLIFGVLPLFSQQSAQVLEADAGLASYDAFPSTGRDQLPNQRKRLFPRASPTEGLLFPCSFGRSEAIVPKLESRCPLRDAHGAQLPARSAVGLAHVAATRPVRMSAWSERKR